jgi:hypothetical protein
LTKFCLGWKVQKAGEIYGGIKCHWGLDFRISIVGLPGNLNHKLSMMDRTQMPSRNEKPPLTTPTTSRTGPSLSLSDHHATPPRCCVAMSTIVIPTGTSQLLFHRSSPAMHDAPKNHTMNTVESRATIASSRPQALGNSQSKHAGIGWNIKTIRVKTTIDCKVAIDIAVEQYP